MPPKIGLLLIHDRPEYFRRALKSMRRNVPAVFSATVEVNDTAHELGFCGAIQRGWDQLLARDVDMIFHVEGDFTFNREVPLEAMAELAADEHIAQVSLKRQPWNPVERRAGGIVECDPDAFEEGQINGHVYTAHRKYWTTNPCLYRRDIAERGWPQQSESEGKFGLSLLEEDPHVVSAIWGGKFDPPMVTHIGKERAGHGY